MATARGRLTAAKAGGAPLMEQDDNAQAAGMSQANFLAEQSDG